MPGRGGHQHCVTMGDAHHWLRTRIRLIAQEDLLLPLSSFYCDIRWIYVGLTRGHLQHWPVKEGPDIPRDTSKSKLSIRSEQTTSSSWHQSELVLDPS